MSATTGTRPRFTKLVEKGLRLALVHAESVVYPDIDIHRDDVPALEAADRWLSGQPEPDDATGINADLLAACRALLEHAEWCGAQPGYSMSDFAPILDPARAAIAKAEGGAA